MTRTGGRRADDIELVIDLDPVPSGGSIDASRDDRSVELDPTRLAAVTGRAVHAVLDFVDQDAAAGGVGWAPSTEPTHDIGSVVMTHYLLGPPDELVIAVGRFFADRRGSCRSLWGSVQLEPAEVDRPVLAAWRGRLRLRTSAVPIPIELDAERWRSVGLTLTMRPARAHGPRIGAHRRWAWFHTGHGVLEQVRLAVEDADAIG